MYTDDERVCVYSWRRNKLGQKTKAIFSRRNLLREGGDGCIAAGGGRGGRREGEGERRESPSCRPHHRVSPPGHEARERGEPSVNRLASRACTYIADPFAFRREGSTKGVKTIHRLFESLFLRSIPSHGAQFFLFFDLDRTFGTCSKGREIRASRVIEDNSKNGKARSDVQGEGKNRRERGEGRGERVRERRYCSLSRTF